MTTLYNVKELKLGGKSAKLIRTVPISAASWETEPSAREEWRSDELVTMAALKNLMTSGNRSVDYQYGDMIQYGTYYYDVMTSKELHYGMIIDTEHLTFSSTTNLTPRDEIFITNYFTGVQDSKILDFPISGTDLAFIFKTEMAQTTLHTVIVSENIDINKINGDSAIWTYKINDDGNFSYASDFEIILPENSTIQSEYNYVVDATTSTTDHVYQTFDSTKWKPHFKVETSTTQITCEFNKNMQYDGHNVSLSWVDSVEQGDIHYPNGAYVFKYES